MALRGRWILMTVAALSLALAAAAPAQERDDVRTTVTIAQLTADHVNGSVAAGEKECRDDRTVLLYRVQGGGKPLVRVAQGHTGEKGSWVIRTPLTPGRYLARVPNQRRGEFNCGHDVSPIASL